MKQNEQPIIIVEDDQEDQEILKEVFQDLNYPYPLRFFSDGQAVLDYLRITNDQPFIILTDVNMPGMNGITLREEIVKDDYLRLKSIPFVFLSTSDGKAVLPRIYALQVQGYFQKPNTLKNMKGQLQLILNYWQECKHPNRRD